MCTNQLGVIYGVKQRQPEERTYLKWLFMYLLLLSERREPCATGIAWLKDDGNHSIFKRPISALEHMKDKQFIDVLAEVDDVTTLLAGHVSLPTNIVGNAHTIRTGVTVGTSAGMIIDTNDASRQARQAREHSDTIFRMANAALDGGRIDLTAFKERLALCKGQISAILVSRFDPKTIVFIKGNMSLELRYHPYHDAIIYADPAHLDIALPPETGWRKIVTQPMSIMTFHCDDLPSFDVEPFELAGI